MSGVGHAIGKVFKGVAGIIKKIWKPLLIAVAVYFTAGAALAYFGAAGAAGGAAALGAEEAGTIGAAAAVGGEGAGVAAGIGSAAAAEAGADAAAGIGGATAGEAAGAAAGGFGADAATGAVADLGSGAGIAGDIGGELGTDVGTEVAEGGAAGGQGILGGNIGDLTAPTAAGGSPSLAMGAGTPGEPSSWWDASLHTAGKVLGTPGVSQLLGSGINAYMQGQMYNQNLQWMAAHAPGQIAGGVPKGVFSGYAGTSPNVAGENVAAHGRVPTVNTQPQQFAANTPGVGGITTDPRNLPGMSPTQQYPGYGTPGYGQQPPGSGPPPVQQQLAMQNGPQQSILGGAEMPYVESPYDQSMV